MRCQEFIQGYSEYADDRLRPEERARFEAHRRTCGACDRYHAVLRRGLAEVRSLPTVRPSPDFLPRLQHRLYHVDDAGRLSGSRHLGSAALVAVAAVGFLALAWLPFATRMSVEIELPAVAVEAPVRSLEVAPERSLFSSGPYVAPVARYWEPLEPSLDGGRDLFGSWSLSMPPASGEGAESPASPRRTLDDSR